MRIPGAVVCHFKQVDFCLNCIAYHLNRPESGYLWIWMPSVHRSGYCDPLKVSESLGVCSCVGGNAVWLYQDQPQVVCRIQPPQLYHKVGGISESEGELMCYSPCDGTPDTPVNPLGEVLSGNYPVTEIPVIFINTGIQDGDPYSLSRKTLLPEGRGAYSLIAPVNPGDPSRRRGCLINFGRRDELNLLIEPYHLHPGKSGDCLDSLCRNRCRYSIDEGEFPNILCFRRQSYPLPWLQHYYDRDFFTRTLSYLRFQ